MLVETMEIAVDDNTTTPTIAADTVLHSMDVWTQTQRKPISSVEQKRKFEAGSNLNFKPKTTPTTKNKNLLKVCAPTTFPIVFGRPKKRILGDARACECVGLSPD